MGLYVLKPRNKLHWNQPISQPEGALSIDDVQDSHSDLQEEEDEIGIDSNEESQDQGEQLNEGTDDDLDSVFMMAYCDYLNRLRNFQFIRR